MPTYQPIRKVVTVVALLGAAATISGATQILDFDGLSDGELVTTQVSGLTFAHAAVLTSGISLNEFEFPPPSGRNVVADRDAPITIAFAPPIASLRGRFTYAAPLSIDAFDAAGNLVTSARSRFNSNLALSGDSGSAPNESMFVAARSGISSVTIQANASGSSLSLDDLEVNFDSVPPSTILTIAPPLDPDGWQRQNVTVGLQSTDNEGGVGVRQIVATGTGAQPFSTTSEGRDATVTITAEGETNISYFAVDNVSNQELTRRTVVRLDKTAPTTTAAADAIPNAAGWYRNDVTIALSAADNPGGIGVQEIVVSAAGGQPIPPTVMPGASASVTIAATGQTTIAYFARDRLGNAETPHELVVNVDKTQPAITCAATPGTIWPPNHMLVAVTIAVQLQDAVSGSAAFTLVSVQSDEPDMTSDAGDAAGDIQGFVVGSATTIGRVRAERLGRGAGRHYTFTYEGSDVAGNVARCAAVVTVPHDQRP
jgi:hypothetical protein